EERALNRSSTFRQDAPVGAELERHDDPADHPHAEGEGEELEPKIEDPPVELVACPQPRAFERGKPCREPDREGWKDDVETDDESELQPREQNRIKHHD